MTGDEARSVFTALSDHALMSHVHVRCRCVSGERECESVVCTALPNLLRQCRVRSETYAEQRCLLESLPPYSTLV